jgi:molecular chaperone GrpE (heat shock protein)
VQESSVKTVGTAKEITDRITQEARSFNEFLKKTNDGEKANLRLEIEKMRRAEGEWLQVVVRMLDHTFALHLAAVRAGQPALVEQLGHFQNACRDVARRVGLSAYVPAPGDEFDAKVHQVAGTDAKPEPGATVGTVLATGYTYQGQLVRPALVSLGAEAKAGPDIAATVEAAKADEVEEPTLL